MNERFIGENWAPTMERQFMRNVFRMTGQRLKIKKMISVAAIQEFHKKCAVCWRVRLIIH